MYTAGHPYNLLSSSEISLIHHNALRILEEMGMVVQNKVLLQVLAESGLSVDFQAERVRFPTPKVEQFIVEAEKYDWENTLPQVTASAGVYAGLYHDPDSNELVPWDEERLSFYFFLANQLENIEGARMLGCRLPVPGALEPLYERIIAWKYGALEAGSIFSDDICPYLLELYQARAADLAQPVEQLFKGTVYLVPALKLGAHEAYQLAFFREHGLQVKIGGSMLTMGANAPVTLAGAVTLNLAEQLAIAYLGWAFFGVKKLTLHSSIAALDMRTTIRPFGRPEMAIANLMTAQLARSYNAAFSGHAGLSDAKLPSVESGAQKALTAIPTLLAGGSLWLDAGLLAIDEVCSPIQLILDNELVNALKRYTAEFQVTPASIGLETIFEAGPAGQYLDKAHTARRFRQEHWNPALWSRQRLEDWLSADRLLDADRARKIAQQYRAKQQPGEAKLGALSPNFDKASREIIERAAQALEGQ